MMTVSGTRIESRISNGVLEAMSLASRILEDTVYSPWN